ncbi:helix-turn-helix domain-containing protein [Sinomicrobium soli]|uniref:helix-turn-helix domain-containing protein n=1 Tax=Sinomicrobium sp. N-1-3-6 TaxID=2219864 RepID=UPI000DCB6346|nr:helix-turn-helix domain-containing protein [Sinomicrobium sp. N-1-3-6]RAV27817.1 hypothetical protein DN748_16955 [Sinomicrobium sp. N-1-3-6]
MDSEHTPEHYIIALLEEILTELRHTRNTRAETRRYLDSADIQQNFNISARTLRRMRKNKEIPFVKLGKKILYSKQKIERLLQEKEKKSASHKP